MNKNSNALVAGAVALLFLLLIASRTAFVVRVDQFAIVTEFGKPVETVVEPGLYFMIPFVQSVTYLDRRIRGWDDSRQDTKTADSRQIDYIAYARWQISEPLLYYMRVGDEQRAHAVMDSIVTDRIQTRIRASKLASIIRETGRSFEARQAVDPRSIFDVYRECNPAINPEFAQTLAEDGRAGTNLSEDIDVMRSHIVAQILEESNAELETDYGIVIRDVHFKYLNYSEQVHGDIIKQIQADRLDDISSYLEIGQKCVGYINRITDSEKGTIIGEGQRTVREIDGKATAQAIQIKARAFGQNPELYQFLKTLEIYENTLGNQTRLVLSTDNPLLSLLTDADLYKAIPAIDLPPLEEVPALPTGSAPSPVEGTAVPAPTRADPLDTLVPTP
jgi:membrane protease subunit HflC